MIVAIPTIFSGVTFRSRLEARWALLLDALGVAWRYEAEGFNLPSGYYLPDFWLPEPRLWLEIKPPFDIDYDRERERLLRAQIICGELAEHTQNRVVLAASNFGEWILPTWKQQSGMVGFFPRPTGGGFDLDAPHLPARCHTCGQFDFVYEGRSDRVCRGACEWRDVPLVLVEEAIEQAIAHAFWNPAT